MKNKQYCPDRLELEQLKQSWANDPCWDLEDTEGFEWAREELLAFSEHTKRAWKAQAEAVLNAKEKLTCPLLSIVEGFKGGEMRCLTLRCAWWNHEHSDCNINLIIRRNK